jgi:outer membrane protein assembly factor BamB
MRVIFVSIGLLLLLGVTGASADDWPEWRGKGRLGVWNETGVLDTFPDGGLKVRWRTPIRAGYAGPAIAEGRIFIVDAQRSSQNFEVIERAVALDEATGEVLWTREWDANYTGLTFTWAVGPRATPTVDEDRVYVLGATGILYCLHVATGEVLWSTDYVKDYDAELPVWGMSGAPLVDGDLLICLVGGSPGAKVIAFNKRTGEEVWRALSSDSEPGYSQPIIINAGGVRQLIVWHPEAVVSLDPTSGEVYWEQPVTADFGMSAATPVQNGAQLLVSSFYNGSLMLNLDLDRPEATVQWQSSSNSEIMTEGLHALIATPVIQGAYIYGICSYGQLRALHVKTGERVWETQAVTQERARWASGFIVRNGDRYFINNDRGELIIAKFAPEGYEEISRTHLIAPTSDPGNRRELKTVNFSHPAYANKHVCARNDEEVLCASLAAE